MKCSWCSYGSIDNITPKKWKNHGMVTKPCRKSIMVNQKTVGVSKFYVFIFGLFFFFFFCWSSFVQLLLILQNSSQEKYRQDLVSDIHCVKYLQSKSKIKKPESCQWHHSGVFNVNFEHISHLLLVLYYWLYKYIWIVRKTYL